MKLEKLPPLFNWLNTANTSTTEDEVDEKFRDADFENCTDLAYGSFIIFFGLLEMEVVLESDDKLLEDKSLWNNSNCPLNQVERLELLQKLKEHLTLCKKCRLKNSEEAMFFELVLGGIERQVALYEFDEFIDDEE